MNKKDVIVICNKINNKISYDQYQLISKPLDYFKNPIKIIIDYIKIKKILKKNKDFELFSHFPCEPYSLLLCFIQKYFKKNIYYAQGSYTLILLSSLKTKFLFNFSKKYFDIIVYSSNYTKKIINEVEKFKSCKLKKVINPVTHLDKNNLKITRNKINKKIICVGHLTPRKGYEELIYLMSILKKKINSNISLFIVGSNTNHIYKKKLEKLIDSLGLKKKIKFFHKANNHDLTKLYLKSDLFILLAKKIGNYFEGFGIVYLEAIRFNLPIIISKESGATDLQKYFKNFKSFNPQDSEKISTEALKILKYNNFNSNKNQNLLSKFCKDNEKKLKNLFLSLSKVQ